eukprot:Nitzschia sp. Nitz4//scaffold158_size52425//11859//12236//NITZ4_006854-RA/size52425-processed-gene-0.48-mRNA-1//-1//CDS//3329537498//7627//frame0
MKKERDFSDSGHRYPLQLFFGSRRFKAREDGNNSVWESDSSDDSDESPDFFSDDSSDITNDDLSSDDESIGEWSSDTSCTGKSDCFSMRESQENVGDSKEDWPLSDASSRTGKFEGTSAVAASTD